MSVLDQFPGGPVLVKERRQDKIQRVIMEAQMEANEIARCACHENQSFRAEMKALARRMADRVREIQEREE